MLRFITGATILGFLAIVGWTVLQQYIPGNANLADVRERVTGPLSAQLEAKDFKFGAPVFIRIFKDERKLEVWLKSGDTFKPFRTYDVCAYSGELGPKLQEGDEQAPEGFYSVGMSQLNPESKYHLSFDLGYPNAYDRAHNRTGSFLMIHGKCVSIGCYAMTDRSIEEIYLMVEAALKGGQASVPVHIFPFVMTDKNLTEHAGSPWSDFWKNLAEGYEIFETSQVPPKVSVAGGRYILQPN